MTLTHTPGPWQISTLATPAHSPEFGIHAGDSYSDLARVIGDNSASNARLIQAAPVLLDTVKAMLRLLTNPDADSFEADLMECKCREAIYLADENESHIEQPTQPEYLWYTMRQSSPDLGTGLDIHGFKEATTGVLKGQTIKCFIESLPGEDAARAKYPDIKFGSKWTDPEISLNHLSDDGDPEEFDGE
jgi:hypothetical protein